MPKKIKVAILDDHQSIIDGYLYRLKESPKIEVTGTLSFGSELEPWLAEHPADVILLDVNVPDAPSNPNPYPILHVIPELLQTYPNLIILVISMHLERALIQAVMEAGASGYLLKDDNASLRELVSIVISVASGGIYLSPQAHAQLLKRRGKEAGPTLSPRQVEALSLCAAYPEYSTAQLATKLNVANSTMRNLLSSTYLKLGVPNRSAAIAKARTMGMITPPTQELTA